MSPGLAEAVARHLVDRGAVRRGRHLRFGCVAHPDRHPSADYEPERGLWVCRSCGAGGGVRDLARRLGLDLVGIDLVGHASQTRGRRPRIPAPPPGVTRTIWEPAWCAVLAQARREARHLAPYHEVFRVSDWLRARYQVVADARYVVSILGSEDPGAWRLARLAARVATDAAEIEAALDGVGRRV
jgi:hypothetical protein